MRIDIISIFPEFFDSYLKESLVRRAIEDKKIKIKIHNLRDYTEGRHKVVDDTPYGGGPGMILKFEPIYKAVQSLKLKSKSRRRRVGTPTGASEKIKVIFLTPRGKKFTQAFAKKYSKLDQLIFICGRYEGIDERVAKYVADESLSIGDYILLGGELPALVIAETVIRLIPGVVGKRTSIEKLDFPQYTKPAEVKGEGKILKVPKVLLSGNHKKIAEWRAKKAKEIK